VTRVLHVCEPPDGGAALNAVDLAVGMAARGIDIEYAGPPESIFYPRLEAAGIRIHRLPLAPSFFNTREDVRAFRTLRTLLGRGFDIVHLHSSKAGVLGRLAARSSAARVVYSPHSFPFVGDLPRPRIELARAIERRLAPLTDTILCVCDWELRLARAEGLHPRHGLSRVYNGVEAPAADVAPDPELREWAGAGPVVASVAVLREQKRIDLLIAAAPRILAADPDVRVAIVGSGPDREKLAALAAELGLDTEPRFRMIPFASSSWAYLRAIDVFVLPSAWEAFPIGVLEALAAGVPQVATDVGGTGEAVLDGVTGLLVPPRDAGALAAAAAALAGDPARRAQMAERSTERHREHFRLETTIAETLAVYRRLLPSLSEVS
jgi:glycosyltransferase involved in cell wall biosynthesis